jgi:Domain of unknown function (DUF2019)
MIQIADLSMKRAKLQDMTVDQLAEQFTAIALDQDKALRSGQHAKFNRLFDDLEAIKQELQNRAGDQRRALIALLAHPNAQVRLKSAIATLALVATRSAMGDSFPAKNMR